LIQANDLRFFEEMADRSLLVNGDAGRLQQALSNLLVNAAKYTPAGGEVRLQVFCEQGDVVMRVSDTGMGIAPEQLESVFDLFVQCDETLHRSKGGMGVGLTLVRSIVERHGGRVRAQSDGPGQGALFEIRVPALFATDTPPTEPDAEKAAERVANGVQIVVVEDQDDNRLVLRTLLELEGYTVHTAENGPKGLAAIERHRPDVALIDIGLPGMSGYQLARQVRESLRNDETYLVALTGYGQPQDIQAALEAGFDSHLVKPLDSQKLAALLAARRRRDAARPDHTNAVPSSP
jgi:two-component system CheB/CheR fusion protein